MIFSQRIDFFSLKCRVEAAEKMYEGGDTDVAKKILEVLASDILKELSCIQ